MGDTPPTVVLPLRDDFTHHDVVVVVGCFYEGYSTEALQHPSRSLGGREQVRQN